MAKTLIIVESPAKAKTIAKFLGRNYTIKPSMGHLRDLPRSQFAVDVENGFEPRYITIRGKGPIVKELRSAAQKSQRVLLATDPDREGEAIAWHLQHLLNLPPDPIRIEFNEITPKAVQEAIKNPRVINQFYVDAQQARRVLDRIVGYKLSPLLWRKVRKGLSAGRVQSVAVRLIVDREQEIEAFESEEYWSLTAWLLSEGENKAFPAKLLKYQGQELVISSEAEMTKITAALEGATYRVSDIKQRERRKNPAPPFTTSTLQQEAYRKLNFTARRTMQVAQQLYEGLELGGSEGTVGLITYIRTDSTRVASVAQLEARDYLAERFGKEYVPEKPRQYKGRKGSQDAHEAIRPTSVWREPLTVKNNLTRDQYRLYSLIWERFVASQMEAAVIDTVTANIDAGPYLFRATGSVIKFPGYLRVYQENVNGEEKEQEQEQSLPSLKVGQVLGLANLEPKQHFTQPPPRYTEASLVKTMEELAIGRPSTYAPTIETILQRGYVVREQKQFIPTELGRVVVVLLKQHFPDIIDVEFTAQMEEQLDLIEEGKLPWRKVLADFYQPFQQLLERAEKEIGTVELPQEISEEKCENCNRNLVVKMGRYGKFLACPGFPECRFTKPLVDSIGVTCPQCGGNIVARRSKKGRKFFGCQNYPECNFVSWDKPTEQNCPHCGTRLVEKSSRQGTRLVCPNKECKYVEQVKETLP
ncbi:MAG: type I DNA topoisomerase [Clostridia bacterium]|nr:type I DNA topoisomerase [Clostridia bacterium]